MTRVTTTLLILLVLMNGTTTIMAASGLSDQLGVQLDPGGDDRLQEANQTAATESNVDEGVGDTLFSLFTRVGTIFSTITGAVFAAPTMFMNLGFPSWIVIPLFAPVYIISSLEIFAIVTGRVFL